MPPIIELLAGMLEAPILLAGMLEAPILLAGMLEAPILLGGMLEAPILLGGMLEDSPWLSLIEALGAIFSTGASAELLE